MEHIGWHAANTANREGGLANLRANPYLPPESLLKGAQTQR